MKSMDIEFLTQVYGHYHYATENFVQPYHQSINQNQKSYLFFGEKKKEKKKAISK